MRIDLMAVTASESADAVCTKAGRGKQRPLPDCGICRAFAGNGTADHAHAAPHGSRAGPDVAESQLLAGEAAPFVLPVRPTVAGALRDGGGVSWARAVPAAGAGTPGRVPCRKVASSN